MSGCGHANYDSSLCITHTISCNLGQFCEGEIEHFLRGAKIYVQQLFHELKTILPFFQLHCCASGLQFLQQHQDLFDRDLNSQYPDCPETSERSLSQL